MSIFITLLVFITASFAEKNLVKQAKLWTPATDHYGSSLDTGKVMIQNNVLTVSFTIAAKTDKGWPYVELISNLEKALQKGQKLSLTYKCDKPLVLKLSQDEFKQGGTNSYAHYQFIVPAAKEWSTVTVNPKDFTQPSWASTQDKNIALNLKTVKDVYFTPKLDVFKGESSVLQVKSFSINN